jgi:uncharacterized membrane protein YdjX (TVP38/TMEM64 family)
MKIVWRLLVLAALAGLALWLGRQWAPEVLTLEELQEQVEALMEFRREHPVQAAVGYMGIYILTATLAIPGVDVLTIASGALFGFWQGVVMTSFASSIGATMAVALSRWLLRGLITSRFATRLEEVNRGLEGSGWVYLASLRLTPVFPFVLVNLLFGVTSFPLGRFYLVSQIFMLPATMVFVNAGTELGSLTSLSGILSPRMLGALMLLALFGPLSRVALRRLGWLK